MNDLPTKWMSRKGFDETGEPMSLSRDDAQRSVRLALGLVRERMAVNSDYGVYVHAQEQLQQMLRFLESVPLPDGSVRDFVDIGLMAAKELEAGDPELAEALMHADYKFKHAR
ncbi:immunity protein Tsi6 family protein [Nocardia sp. NPDC059240]|uniref:immunity protein Tsi6 family protein n=1 Tax=Nocardia sp. NPDC059240 TaxID=3346786 RepID=UPI0036D15940